MADLPKIKFSHFYKKFGKFHNINGMQFILTSVTAVKSDALLKTFVDYDTTTVHGWKYELPKGRVLVLGFTSVLEETSPDVEPIKVTDEYTVMCDFTTVRRWTESKHDYYLSMLDKTFVVEVLTHDGPPVVEERNTSGDIHEWSVTWGGNRVYFRMDVDSDYPENWTRWIEIDTEPSLKRP